MALANKFFFAYEMIYRSSYFGNLIILPGDGNSPLASHGTGTVKRCVLSTELTGWEELSLCSEALSRQENLAGYPQEKKKLKIIFGISRRNNDLPGRPEIQKWREGGRQGEVAAEGCASWSQAYPLSIIWRKYR